MPVPYEGLVGLSSAEAAQQLKTYGPNSLAKGRRLHPLMVLLSKFKSPLLIIIIVVSIVSFIIGEHVNGAILVFMVLLSVILDFTNSYKSEKTLERLLKQVVNTATVIRDGEPVELEFPLLVPGDVVLLQAGDVIPADGLVLEAKNLFANQAVLTGESFPVEKTVHDERAVRSQIKTEAPDALFMGTSIVTGTGAMQIVNTGVRTEFGKIADRLQRDGGESDFERNIRRFSLFIMRLTFIMVAVVFLGNALSGHGWFVSFVFALAIAIGLTPELLPVIISVSLSRGSVKMAKKDVIVKNLSSIQNFGSMNVLCTDKTGTLTQDKISLVKYVNAFGQSSEHVLQAIYLNSFYHTGVENPLDDAVKNFRKLNIGRYDKVDEIPFDFKRKRESVVVAYDGRQSLITKGAPEEIFKICTGYRHDGDDRALDDPMRERMAEEFKTLSADGFRVLAVALKDTPATTERWSLKDEAGLTFLGFAAFLDPPKDTALEAIKELEDYGIEIKILTGDTEILTQKICRDIKLPIKGLLTGDEIAHMNDYELQQRVLETTIFARVTPDQKERIIVSLKNAHRVVGYLGDGINDAPALRVADIGITVNNAVDVAKETADIVLLKKSLTVLKDGVIEGRKTFINTLKYVMMGLSSNFGNMFSMMAASFFLPFLPMLPAQVLLNNFTYDMSQLTLSTDNVDSDAIRRPVAWDLGFIRKYMLIFGPISSLFDFLTFGVLLWVYRLPEHQFQTGWFIESIATQVFVIYVIRTSKIPFLQSRPSLKFFLNTFLAVAAAWVLPYLVFAHGLDLQPLPWPVLAVILGLVLVYLVLVEIAKRIFYRYSRNLPVKP